jgi:zinc D-Ala-D-Ala carboxypeptidase
VNKEALKNLKKMQADAKALGLNIPLVSGYRSYETQERLYNKYVKKDGEKKANTYSAKPGESEHQTGLAFDIGSVDRSFANTIEAKWLAENAYLYGFIIRYPKDKTNVTGYIYEPWHVRYLGEKKQKMFT